MAATERTLWEEALARLRELEEEVKRVEEMVVARLETQPGAPSQLSAPATASGAPMGEPARSLLLRDAPRLVAQLRRQLQGEPLRVLALDYPPSCFDRSRPPEQARASCLLHHALNTARLAMFVAARHGYRPTSVEVVGLCGLLHDVGMEGVPAELFVKAGPLSEAERRRLQDHAPEGEERVRACHDLDGLLRAVVPRVVRQHHERTDGSGYPDGLDAPHIHEFARLVALAEAYETMVTPRPYKPARLPHDAMTALLLEAFGKSGPARYDRRLATAMLRALSLYPIGSGVVLEDGSRGQVVESNPEAPEKPHVRLLWGPGGRRLERPRVVDLRQAGVRIAKAIPWPPPGEDDEP